MTQCALDIPEIVEGIVASALSLQTCEAASLRLVNKLFNERADGIIWEEIWLCDDGHAYGSEGGTVFDLQAMLQRRPELCLYLKHANFEMSRGLHLQFRLDLIARARNMTWLSVDSDGLEHLAKHWAENKFALPSLKGLRIDVAPVREGGGAALLQKQAFLQSLTSVTSLSIFTVPHDGQFFPCASYGLAELLQGMKSAGPGIASRIETFGLLLSTITSCSREDMTSLLQIFTRLKNLRIDIPAGAIVSHLVELFPGTLEKLSVRCGLDTLCDILEDMEDTVKLPKLREVPVLQLFGIGEVTGFGMKRESVDRAIKGLAGRKGVKITATDIGKLYALVTDDELGSEESSTTKSDSDVSAVF